MLHSSLSNKELVKYLSKQLNNNFPDVEDNKLLPKVVKKALKKVEYCFKFIALPYYKKDNKPFFNHLNADHYTVFIYYCSYISYKYNDINLASKFFYLNKILHSFHCMYDTKLPDIFIVCHGVGTVLGKANYKNFLVLTQGCTIGANANWEYPQLSKYLILYPNSSILGDSIISKYNIISNNTMLLNTKTKSNKLLVGQYPNCKEKSLNKDIFDQFFIRE